MRISNILSKVKDIKNIVQILDKKSVLPILKKVVPNVVIYDINMNGPDSFKILKEIKKLFPGALIITLTSFSVEQYRERCRVIGIENCLDKASDFEQIPKLITGIFEPT